MFGDVFLATDLDEGGQVAVKLFYPDVKLDSVILEAQLQRRLSEHHRIVDLRNLDVRTGAGPIVVTRYMPAGSVGSRIGPSGAGLLLGLRWVIDVADALVHAHANGVYHRDAKPSNLLLDGTGHVALCDFGVAEDSFAGAGPNAAYAALVAPELAASGTTTEQTEVWMLGVLLYRLVLGAYPHPGGGGAIRLDAQVKPDAVDPQIPVALSRIMQRALAVDLRVRYATVAEMREDLLAVKVVAEFSELNDPDTYASWQATAVAGLVQVDIRATARSTYTARMRVDRGSGLRKVDERPPRSTLAQAQRDARTLMRSVVEGRQP